MRANQPPYGLRNFLSFILRDVIKYRKKVIEKNIKIAFPHYDQSQVTKLRRAFYKQFAVTICEVMYTYSYPQNIINHITFDGFEQIQNDLNNGKSVIITGGHFFNWEWSGITLTIPIQNDVYGIYKKLSNPFFEQHFLKARSQYGLKLVSTRDSMGVMESVINGDSPSVFLLAGDQSPSNTKRAIWVNFFNKKTAFLRGTERLATKHNLPVYFLDVKNPKMGQYNLKARRLIVKNQAYTQALATEVESTIKTIPRSWLWSHNRWKHNPELKSH